MKRSRFQSTETYLTYSDHEFLPPFKNGKSTTLEIRALTRQRIGDKVEKDATLTNFLDKQILAFGRRDFHQEGEFLQLSVLGNIKPK